MNPFHWRDAIASATHGEQRKSTIVVLTSTLLMLTWQCVGSVDFYTQHLKSRLVIHEDPEYTAALYFFVTAFVFLGLIPLLIIKFVLRERLSDYGLTIGDGKWTLTSFAVLGPPILILVYGLTRFPEAAEVYSINPKRDIGFGLHALCFSLFYVGWEIHFRGFLQFGLAGAMGRVNAILVGVLASSLMHIGRPVGDMYGGILAAVLWGILAFQSRSILSGLLQHALLGLSLDYFLWIQRA